MENTQDRENKNKKLLILALLIALLACSFGFAAYSRSIDLINEYRDENYVVYRGGVLSINPDKPENGTVKPSSYGGADAEPAELTENGLLILMYILLSLVKVLHIHSMVLIRLK